MLSWEMTPTRMIHQIYYNSVIRIEAWDITGDIAEIDKYWILYIAYNGISLYVALPIDEFTDLQACMLLIGKMHQVHREIGVEKQCVLPIV